MTEAAFQAQVVELAHLCHWQVLHVRRSIGKGSRWTTTTSIVGWPDLFCYRPGDRFAAELKSDTGKPTAEQLSVLEDLREAGIDSYLWTPADWDAIVARIQQRPTMLS